MISVVLATHNEAKNLPQCLNAVKAWADEIIVADGESTDDTVSIAESYQAKIIFTSNKANFHINKQLAMDAAKFPLVLQLDADEVVDQELAEFIQNLDKTLAAKSYQVDATEPVAWWLKRKNYLLQTWLSKGGQYPDPMIRLYLNGKARLPHRDVHEQMEVDGSTATAQGHLLHQSSPTFSDYLRKFNAYTDFKAHQLKTQNLPINWSNSFNYLIWLPLTTFLKLYLRHRGYVDGLAGLVFASWSGLHHALAYLKLWELYELES
ncbi:MAG TPA: hypothetical protein DEP87_00140, partial [Candidatus Pacebacteria bacterium]|nr:hypothetical protein [Candidatus Paceibacterota bacterium]